MEKEEIIVLPERARAAESLTTVLGQTEHVKVLIDECAEELSSVNATLKQDVITPDQQTKVEEAIEKSELIEGKVQEAANKLLVANQALEAEVCARQVLEVQLAAVTQDEEVARHASLHDPLTGLPNRALFDNRLEHGLAQARRYERTLAVLFMDLDCFKEVNDVHGHDVGDAVLKIIASRLKENTRNDDTVCRMGGDEFLYLLTEVASDEAIAVIAEKIAGAVGEPCHLNVGGLTINLSIGIAVFPRDGGAASVLIKKADTAMYEAKRNKSCYAFAS